MGADLYPNAPLRFVAFEARFPQAPSFTATVPPEHLRRALRHRFPRNEVASVQSLEIGPGAVRQGAETRHRFMTKDRTMSVTLGAQTLIVETTSYVQFERFRDTIEEVASAVERLDEVSGLLRVGLRFIDEVRLPVAVTALNQWAAYVDPSLTSAVGLVPGSPLQLVGMIETTIAEQRSLVMRYGAQPRGRIVDPNGPLRIPHDDPEDQPLFFIDIDSCWTSPEDDLPPFDTTTILGICNELHVPTREVFESSITEKLRQDVFRAERSSR